ncbi:MAG: gas vesicle protein [Chlorobiales bacterium]|nr:gas vesicle protein [Chlorobiales bacterium]
MGSTKKNIIKNSADQQKAASQSLFGIVAAREKVVSFLEDALMQESVKIVKVLKTEDGWETLAEVYEESAFIRELGLQTRVKDKNLYEVKLANDLDIISFEKISTLE